MGDVLFIYAILFVALFFFMTAAFLLSRMLDKRDDLTDVIWGIGFILIVFYVLLLTREATLWQQLLPVVLVTIWGLRLSAHILKRFLHSEGDPRYQALQEKWGANEFWRSYTSVFLLQGLLMLIISLPAVLAIINPATNAWLIGSGITLWVIGFSFEAVGDAQLTRFLQKPENKGKLMTTGLWEYTRHPNYFGEVTQWWGLAVIALSAPYGWLGVLGAITITVLITRISGVPLAEARYKNRSDWQAYARRTSALIPKPPRKV